MLSMSFSNIISIVFLIIAGVSGIWLFVIKKNKEDNKEEEEAYQKKLASEYREQWLQNQNIEEE